MVKKQMTRKPKKDGRGRTRAELLKFSNEGTVGQPIESARRKYTAAEITPTNIRAAYGTKIPASQKARIKSFIPVVMHISKIGILCFRKGLNPVSLKNVANPHLGNKFQKGNKEGEKRRSPTPFIDAFKKKADEIVLCPVISKRITFAESLANMQRKAIIELFEDKSYAVFDRLATQFSFVVTGKPSAGTKKAEKSNPALQEYDNLPIETKIEYAEAALESLRKAHAQLADRESRQGIEE